MATLKYHDGQNFIELSAGGSGNGIEEGDTPPEGIEEGRLWLDTSDNTFQDVIFNGIMHKSDSVLENYSEKIVVTTGVIDLSKANAFSINVTANTTFSITNAKPNTAHYFTLVISMGTVRTLIFPVSVKWLGKEIPDMTEANTDYILTFVSTNGGSTWYGSSGDY